MKRRLPRVFLSCQTLVEIQLNEYFFNPSCPCVLYLQNVFAYVLISCFLSLIPLEIPRVACTQCSEALVQREYGHASSITIGWTMPPRYARTGPKKARGVTGAGWAKKRRCLTWIATLHVGKTRWAKLAPDWDPRTATPIGKAAVTSHREGIENKKKVGQDANLE